MNHASRAPFRTPSAAILLGLAYYVGAKAGFALTLRPVPVSTLWPPNALILVALLLSPRRVWWILLLAVFPAHMLVELQGGVPIPMALCWYVSNCSEALLGAVSIRYFVKGRFRFEKLRDVGIFILGAGLFATLLSSLLDAAFVTLNGWGSGSYWYLVRTRFFSNALASLTLVPVVVTWRAGGITSLRKTPFWRLVEATLLTAGLLAVCIAIFAGRVAGPKPSAVLLYSPLPFLVWAAVRFGPKGVSAALLLVSSLAIWGAVHLLGPFIGSSPADNALAIQLFLLVIYIPLLSLAAIVQERIVGERVAREHQDRLDLGLSAAQVGTWEWDIPRDRALLSERCSHILGLAAIPQEISLGGFLDLVHADDRAPVSEAIHQAIDLRTPYECEYRVNRPGSGTAWVLAKGNTVYDAWGRPQRMLGVNVDISERKVNEELRREERALRESEARLRELADAMPQIVWSVQPDGTLDYFNRRWYELTGAQENGAQQKSWLPMTHPDDRQMCVDALATALRTGEPFQLEHRIRVQATGEYRWHLARARPVRNEAGVVIRWYGTCTDIEHQKMVERALRDVQSELERRVAVRTTELSAAVVELRQQVNDRVAAENELRSSEERFGKAFHSNPSPMAIVGRADYRILEVNQRWVAMFGFAPQEAIGHSMAELGLFAKEADRIEARAMLEGRNGTHELELDMLSRAGDLRHAVIVADTVEMGGEPCFIISMRDVTERKRAELELLEQRRELAHLSRVASLGELSGALAHEVSQPLAAILANAQAAQRLMAKEKEFPAEIRDILRDIVHNDQRAGQVIHRLRTLLRKGDLDPRPLDLPDVVTEVLELMHSELIHRKVVIRTSHEPELPLVLADRVQLQQVLLNLIVNACDAMSERPAGKRELAIVTALAGKDAVQLSVIDQGIGIPKEKLERVFEPFFTSKTDGLGLGLAICRSIVTAHGGRLWAVNNPEGGATFHLLLGSRTLVGTEGEPGILTGTAPDSRAATVPLSARR